MVDVSEGSVNEAYALKYALHIQPANAIYSYVPKNACTTLKYSTVLTNRKAVPPALFEQSDRLVSSYRASLFDIEQARYRFIVLRCPWQRLASLFLDKFVAGRRTGRALRLNSDRTRTHLAEAIILRALYRLGARSYIDHATFSFRNFVDLLTVPGALEIDHHWRKQTDFDLEPLGYSYDDVFSLANIEDAFEKITQRTGMKIYDTRDLSGHSANGLHRMTDRCYADTPLTDLAAMRTAGMIPAHTAMYDPELVAIVRDLYHADLELYNRHLGSEGLIFDRKPN